MTLNLRTLKNRKTILIVFLFICNITFAKLSNQNNIQKNDTTSSQEDFLTFSENYSFENLFIVFAGPFPASPTSSFGHIFLLLEPKQKRPFLLWDTIDFSALTGDHSSIEFFYKGIFGGLIGKYSITPFYEKLREYTFIESRSLWLFPFSMTSEEADKFLYSIYKQKDKNFKYRFSNKNCASQIDSLLRSTVDMPTRNSNMFVFPHSILDGLKERIEKPIYIESASKILNDKLEENSIDISNGNIQELTDAEKAILLNSLEWKYNQEGKHLSPTEKRELDKLRVEASSIGGNTYLKLNNKREFHIHPSMLLGGGIRMFNTSSPEYLLTYRFGLHEFYENSSVYPKHDFLTLFKIEVGINNNAVRLNEFMLFNQISLEPITPLSNYLSWKLGFGAIRKYEFDNTPLATGLFTGVGYTFAIFKNYLNISFLINVEPVYLQNLGFTVISGPEIISILNISERVRWQGIIKGSIRVFNNSRMEFSATSNVGLELSRMSNLQIQFEYFKNDYLLAIIAQYYIY